MSYFLISNNDDVNNSLNNNDDDYKLSYVERWSHYVEINFARHNHDTDG